MKNKTKISFLILAVFASLILNTSTLAKTTRTKAATSRPSSSSTATFLKVKAEGTLKGGIVYKTYKGTKSVKRRNSYNPDASSSFEYSIDWPVSGPSAVVSKIRNKIVKILKNQLPVQLPAPTATNLPQIVNQIVNAAISYDKRNDGNWTERDYNITLSSNGAAVTVNGGYADYDGPVNGSPQECSRAVYRISDGKELTKNMLPDWEELRPYVTANFYNNDERVFGEYGDFDRESLPAPDNIPIFEDDKVSYEYWVYEISYGAAGWFYGYVNYADLYDHASDELKTFLPDVKTIKEMEKDSWKNPTKVVIIEGYVTQEGDTNSDNARAFQEAVLTAPVYDTKKEDSNEIYTEVEQTAEFPGGLNALMRWIAANMRYPDAAAQNGVQGKVIVKFVVEKDGSITNVSVIKGVDKDLDKEAFRIIKKMPNWIPGKNNGVPVRTYFTLPVTFHIN